MEESENLNDAVLSAPRADYEEKPPWDVGDDEPPWLTTEEKTEEEAAEKEDEASSSWQGGTTWWWDSSWWNWWNWGWDDGSWWKGSWWDSQWDQRHWGQGRGSGTGWYDFIPDSESDSDDSLADVDEPKPKPGQEEWWQPQPKAKSRPAASPRLPKTPPYAPEEVLKGHGKTKGIGGKPGKDGKGNNLPTRPPLRSGAKGGQVGAPRRSGGANASWYRQFYALKKFASTEEVKAWLKDNPHPERRGRAEE